VPAWGDYIENLENINPKNWQNFINSELEKNLAIISKKLNCPNVILYASAFLQKPNLPSRENMMTMEDMNGFMNAVYGMKDNEKLALIIHTPGGEIYAADAIIDYIHQKFNKLITIVPLYALSAGTIVCLSSDEIIMGKQSQLGPTDPQILYSDGQRSVSALSIIHQFERAKKEITANQDLAGVWYPILQTLGEGLMEEAFRVIEYSKELIKKWLSVKKNINDPEKIVKFFCEEHESHGKRINKEEAKAQGLNIKDLEEQQSLQDAVLSAYHLLTIMFERGPVAKIIKTNHKRQWLKIIQFSVQHPINQ